MANSSPPAARIPTQDTRAVDNRISHPWGSTIDLSLEDLRLEDRNTEESHQRSLAQAKRDHEGLRKTAIEVLKHYHLQEEQRRVQIEQQQQEERLRAEAKLAAERQRLEALRAKSVPIPPPPPPLEPAPPASAPKPASPAPLTNGQLSEAQNASASASANGGVKTTTPPTAPEPQKPPSSTLNGGFPAPNQAQPAQQTSTSASTASPSHPPPQVNGTPATAPKPQALSLAPVAKPDRHVEVHKKLKQLRVFVDQQRKVNPQLKARMGEMRREIRTSVGQLVEGALSNNRQAVSKITASLQEALHGRVPSELVDPNEFLLEPRSPVENAANNAPQLPSLFVFLLNVFSKSVISQFINECSAKPQLADAVGTVVAKIFSDPEFQWRGGSMIDLLLAKYRIVCPVLFGFRGSDRTEQGRLRVGWRKEDGTWIPEQMHADRMTGLGAGFGAIALRDFSRSRNQNPFPPARYWAALARIVNTPANEMSDTQCLVLKAMIENYEQRFIHFYGNAAVAALRLALVEFPAKAPKMTAAVGALPVLAQLLKGDYGLILQ
ncbi:hypothetical protein MAPG_11225 [Magnaporthiopsis poae ATCC 64411]|uniref:mRNA export factor GLE1 n=1 Tax=Magnaporthiopsis poae (strain ATCC 64411 / 73-15) TaxID=644358 RepID=A0A0C4EEQ1_MAGP6|nr:hypothetical protein MAPG_11225 [Magnaporthiopsis poae ATCC 64411]